MWELLLTKETNELLEDFRRYNKPFTNSRKRKTSVVDFQEFLNKKIFRALENLWEFTENVKNRKSLKIYNQHHSF